MLGLSPQLIDTFEKTGSGDPKGCLQEVLQRYLANTKQPSVEELCRVVKLLDETKLSIKLRGDYNGTYSKA